MDAEVLVRAVLKLREELPDPDDYSRAIVELSRVVAEQDDASPKGKAFMRRADLEAIGKAAKRNVRGQPCPPGYTPKRDGCIKRTGGAANNPKNSADKPKQTQSTSVYSDSGAKPQSEGGRVGTAKKAGKPKQVAPSPFAAKTQTETMLGRITPEPQDWRELADAFLDEGDEAGAEAANWVANDKNPLALSDIKRRHAAADNVGDTVTLPSAWLTPLTLIRHSLDFDFTHTLPRHAGESVGVIVYPASLQRLRKDAYDPQDDIAIVREQIQNAILRHLDQRNSSFENTSNGWLGRARMAQAIGMARVNVAACQKIAFELRRNEIKRDKRNQKLRAAGITNTSRLLPEEVSYTAAVLNDVDRKHIERVMKPVLDGLKDKGWKRIDASGNKLPHHRTLVFPGPLPNEEANSLVGTRHELRVIGYGVSDKAVALWVEDNLPNHTKGAGRKHVTIAYNPKAGGAPKDSNDIPESGWHRIETISASPFYLMPRVEEIPKQ